MATESVICRQIKTMVRKNENDKQNFKKQKKRKVSGQGIGGGGRQW